jgi:hypothetical protein
MKELTPDTLKLFKIRWYITITAYLFFLLRIINVTGDDVAEGVDPGEKKDVQGSRGELYPYLLFLFIYQ